MVFKRVPTPCVGICSTGIGDDVCRGCKRFAHEVIDWNLYSETERRVISQRLESFLVTVVSHKLVVVDVDRLRLQLKHQQIAFNEQQDPHCWIFDLLKAGASQINDLAVYGLAKHRLWHDVSLVDIRNAIDKDFYTLSSAHYERYFAPGFGEQVSGATESHES